MIHKRWFGTDGMRGEANTAPIRPDYLVRLAQAATKHFLNRPGHHQKLVIIGKDTRLSGYMVESALMAGFISAGMDVRKVGPLPTSAVAMLTQSLRADIGVMISASHNPYTDNGVKLFGPNGHKLSDEDEVAIEALMESEDFFYAPANAVGRAATIEDAKGRYIESLKSSLPRHFTLDGMRVVVDCAHGSAYRIAPAVFFEMGAEVIPLSVLPNGTNINADCGAIHPETMARTVVETGADIGFAVDGDSDRLVVATHSGTVLSGEALLAVLATWLHAQGELTNNKVVTTTMASLGLEEFLMPLGIELLRAPVGDRYVMEWMRHHLAVLGGEPSGHLMMHQYAASADALLVGLHILAVMVAKKLPIETLAAGYRSYPVQKGNFPRNAATDQRLRSMKLIHRIAELHDQWQEEVPASHDTDSSSSAPVRRSRGQIILRPSGTEPIVRLMVEHQSAEVTAAVFAEISTLITEDEHDGAVASEVSSDG
ncbi:MAG: phosphoglucosamine mutase [Alphaproteobacteria bacterium]|nr:phosphoglucosamine mutase [Alphaproteobacteria bacterium]